MPLPPLHADISTVESATGSSAASTALSVGTVYAASLPTPSEGGTPLSLVRASDVRPILPATSLRPRMVRVAPASDPARTLLTALQTLAQGAAERASVSLHQNSLLEAFDMDRLLRRDMSHQSAKNFRLALMYSDMGKISRYKAWYTTPIPNPNKELDFK